MFKIDVEELKRELEEKMSRLKKVDEQLREMAPVNPAREIKEWQKRWEAWKFYNLKKHEELFDDDDFFSDPGYSSLPGNIFHHDD